MLTKKLSLFFIPLVLITLWSCGNEKKKEEDKTVQVSAGHGDHPTIRPLTEQIQSQPANANLYFQRGNAYHKLKDDSLALEDFKKAASLDSTRSEYMSAIGDLMFEHKDIEGSIKWFKKSIELNPKDVTSHLKFAKMLVYTAQYQDAFNEINIVLRQDVYNPEGYFLKGIIYKNMKDTLKAISSFQTAVQVDPGYRDAMLQLGLIYAARKNQIAATYFDNAFKADTTDVFPLYAKAMFHQENNNLEEAKTVYRKCILYDPQYGNAYFNTGWILMQQDSLEKAIRQFDLVTRIEPGNAEAHYNKGLCYEMLQKKQEAISEYKQALVFDKEYVEPKNGLRRLGAAVE